jgi:hypothetical protein
VEECTYFWGVNTSWGIDTAESKGPLHQEDNQAPQPTCCRDPGCGCDLSLILRANHEEEKLPHMRDDLPTFLSRSQGNNTRWDSLGYPVQFLVQSNNKTMRPRIIYNMTFP